MEPPPSYPGHAPPGTPTLETRPQADHNSMSRKNSGNSQSEVSLVCMYVYIVYVCMYVCMYLCMYVHMYVLTL